MRFPFATRNKKLLGAPGRTTRSKDAIRLEAIAPIGSQGHWSPEAPRGHAARREAFEACARRNARLVPRRRASSELVGASSEKTAILCLECHVNVSVGVYTLPEARFFLTCNNKATRKLLTLLGAIGRDSLRRTGTAEPGPTRGGTPRGFGDGRSDAVSRTGEVAKGKRASCY